MGHDRVETRRQTGARHEPPIGPTGTVHDPGIISGFAQSDRGALREPVTDGHEQIERVIAQRLLGEAGVVDGGCLLGRDHHRDICAFGKQQIETLHGIGLHDPHRRARVFGHNLGRGPRQQGCCRSGETAQGQ